MKAEIAKLRDHYVIVGFGRMGRALSHELAERNQHFVIIESNSERAQTAAAEGWLVIEGDAHDEDVIRDSGIERARGLATCLPEDADNVFVTLTVRGINEDINIIARTEDVRTHSKLIRAGANRVVCPPLLTANKVMSMMVTPLVDVGSHHQEFSHSDRIQLFEVAADELPVLIGEPIGQNHVRSRTGITVIAVERKGKREMSPTSLFVPLKGDRLILAGTERGLARARELFGGEEL